MKSKNKYDVIYLDGETIIGYSEDIATDIIVENWDEDELIKDLLNELNKLDHELVYISYDPMGAYSCYKLEIGKELFVV